MSLTGVWVVRFVVTHRDICHKEWLVGIAEIYLLHIRGREISRQNKRSNSGEYINLWQAGKVVTANGLDAED
jgi:hypothetical protein